MEVGLGQFDRSRTSMQTCKLTPCSMENKRISQPKNQSWGRGMEGRGRLSRAMKIWNDLPLCFSSTSQAFRLKKFAEKMLSQGIDRSLNIHSKKKKWILFCSRVLSIVWQLDLGNFVKREKLCFSCDDSTHSTIKLNLRKAIPFMLHMCLKSTHTSQLKVSILLLERIIMPGWDLESKLLVRTSVY